MSRNVVVVGGVAGGMSFAARLARLDASCRITVLERGSDVSFANCGMPYYIGGVIRNRALLTVASKAMLQARFGLDIRTRHAVTEIRRAEKQVRGVNLETGEPFSLPYDQLVLATGAEPVRLPIPGAGQPHVLTLNTLEDMDRIAHAAERAGAAVIIGGGFIGLELAENLRERGLQVSIVELTDQVMPPMDPEMTIPILQALERNGVQVLLGRKATEIGTAQVTLDDGTRLPAEVVCMCAGVRPRSELAAAAGLDLGPRGHILVDKQLRTSDPDIFAVGDVVQVWDRLTGDSCAVPLAGPANRQGRTAANIVAGRQDAFPGVCGSAIVKVFDQVAGQSGWSEKRLRAAGMDYRKMYAHPFQHPNYYPGAQQMCVKLLYRPDGGILGVQAIGGEGVDVVVNVIATAMQGGMTVFDLEQLELVYSPQWGAAKHAVNIAGFAAANHLRGDVCPVYPDDPLPGDAFLLDVRTPEEFSAGSIPGAVNIPVDSLSERLAEIPRDRPVVTYCAVGLRGYVAARKLALAGFQVSNLSGGFKLWNWTRRLKEAAEARPPQVSAPASSWALKAGSEAFPGRGD
ncbi:MAG TPA: FAD-dependent oxidoreductase [Candidatus Hydrogenedentes bacterium]|nr:FAD-dependent oxidoreductase [Candidatus Hydrogenedentota bacterium]